MQDGSCRGVGEGTTCGWLIDTTPDASHIGVPLSWGEPLGLASWKGRLMRQEDRGELEQNLWLKVNTLVAVISIVVSLIDIVVTWFCR